MFAQIIRDMYVPPEILRELTDDQKEVLHYEIRREQVRRYNIWQQELEKQDVLQTKKTPVNVSKPEKHVSFVEDSKLSVIIEDAKKAFSDVSVLIVRDGNVISPTLPGCRSSPSGRDFTDGVIDDKHVTPTSSSSANPSTSFPMSSAMDFNSTTIDINLRRLSQLDGIPKSERLSLVSHNEESSRQVPTTDGESNGASIKVQEVVRVLGTDNSSTSLSRAPERPPTRSQDYLQDSYSRDQSSETEDLASSGAPELPEISPMCSSAPKAANIPEDWRPLASSANSVGLSRFSPTVSSGSAVVKGPEKSSPPASSANSVGLSRFSPTVSSGSAVVKGPEKSSPPASSANSVGLSRFSPTVSSGSAVVKGPEKSSPPASSANSVGLSRFSPTVSSGSAVVKGPEKSSPPASSANSVGLSRFSPTVSSGSAVVKGPEKSSPPASSANSVGLSRFSPTVSSGSAVVKGPEKSSPPASSANSVGLSRFSPTVSSGSAVVKGPEKSSPPASSANSVGLSRFSPTVSSGSAVVKGPEKSSPPASSANSVGLSRFSPTVSSGSAVVKGPEKSSPPASSANSVGLSRFSPTVSSGSAVVKGPEKSSPPASSANSVGLSRFSPTVSSGSAVVKGPEKSSPPASSANSVGLSRFSPTVSSGSAVVKGPEKSSPPASSANSVGLSRFSPTVSSGSAVVKGPEKSSPPASSANSVGLSRFSPTVSSGSAVVKGPEKSSPPINSPMNGLSESSSAVAPVARITKDADQMFENTNLRNSHSPEQFSESDEISTTSDCDVEPSKPLKTLRLRERDSHSSDHTEVNRPERSFPNPCCFFPASNVFMFSSSSGSFKKKRSSSLGSPVLSSPKSAIATENTSRRQSTVNMMISRFESAKISTEGDKPTDKKVQQKTVRLSPEIRRRQQELFGNVGPSAVSESPVNTKSACSWFAETEAARLMNEFKLPSTVDVVNRTKNSNHDEFANVPPWFHGLLSKAAAEEMLQHANVNGSFLVRVSSNFPGYVISGLWAYRCHHTPVSVVGKSSGNHSASSRQSDVAPTYQLYGLTNSIQFQSLQELIGYYSSHPLSSSTDHLLWHPVDQPPSKSGLPDYFSLFYPCVTGQL
ncbi:unnamed protein product [Calicophoron daubneyi]|uniref:SH2 domain-containing protein n=1 Tax=Calicophoron daubneyi TaxID=300641 RepID=A0AAV2T454_CALDB